MRYAIATAHNGDMGFAIAHRGVESNGRIFQQPQWLATVGVLEQGDFILLVSEEVYPSAYLYGVYPLAGGGNTHYSISEYDLSRYLNESRRRVINAIAKQERSRNANR